MEFRNSATSLMLDMREANENNTNIRSPTVVDLLVTLSLSRSKAARLPATMALYAFVNQIRSFRMCRTLSQAWT